jgi:hypothetical protein
LRCCEPLWREMNPTCRYCEKQFIRDQNHSKACRYHPESFTGETAQRWAAPGETKDGGKVHNFWSCCGADSILAPGCCYTGHSAFGEPESIDLRLPGMGIEEKSSS